MTITLEPGGRQEAAAADRAPGAATTSQFVSVDDLAVAYATKGRPDFLTLREAFQKQEHGKIVESYFAQYGSRTS